MEIPERRRCAPPKQNAESRRTAKMRTQDRTAQANPSRALLQEIRVIIRFLRRRKIPTAPSVARLQAAPRQRDAGISSPFDRAAPDTRRAIHTDARAGAED